MSLCSFCFKSFEPAPSIRPASYCSNACKCKASRARKEGKELLQKESKKYRKSNVSRIRYENEAGSVFYSQPIQQTPNYQPTKEIRTFQDLKDYFNAF